MGDLYGWDGQDWQWIPSQVSDDGLTLEATLDGLPSLLMIAQSQALPARVTLGVSPAELDAATQVAGVTALCVDGLTIGADGAVTGELPAAEALATFSGEALLAVSNDIDGVVRSDLVDNLLVDETARAKHVAALMDQVASSPYAGIELAYSGIDPTLRDEFTALVSELADALHQADKLLVVEVDTPTGRGSELGHRRIRLAGAG